MSEAGATFKFTVEDQQFLNRLMANGKAIDDFANKAVNAQKKAQYAAAGIPVTAGGTRPAAPSSLISGLGTAAGVGGALAAGSAAAVAFTTTSMAKTISMVKPFIMDLSRAAREQEEAETQLQAALNATGKALQLNVRELANYAGELERTTKFSDEAIIASFKWFAQLRRFPASGIKDAMKLALDMAEVAGEKDPQASVRRLARAIEDPRRATRSLRSAGIMINTGERELIESLDKHGKYEESVRAILNAVQRAVGGAAELQARTLEGQMHQIEGMTDDLKKFGGYFVNQFLTPIATGLRDGLREWTAWGDGIVDALKKPSDELKKLAEEIGRNRFMQAILGVGVVEGMTPDQRAMMESNLTATFPEMLGNRFGNWARYGMDAGGTFVANIAGRGAEAASYVIPGARQFQGMLGAYFEEDSEEVKQKKRLQFIEDVSAAEGRAEDERERMLDDENNAREGWIIRQQEAALEAEKKAITEAEAYRKRKANEFQEHLGRMRDKFYKETRTPEEVALDRLKELKQVQGWGMLEGGADGYNRAVGWIRQEYLEGGDFLKKIEETQKDLIDDRKDLARIDKDLAKKSEFSSSIESLAGLWNKIQVGAASTKNDPVAELKKQREELAKQAATREWQLNQLIMLQRNRETYAASFR